MLEAENLYKYYGKGESRYAALNGVSLNIKKGESIAIVGKSGSGKSTLMHLLAALDKPTEGAVRLDGKSYGDLKEQELNKLRNRRFGFVFQQFFLNGRESVLDNVALPLKIAGMKRTEREKRALERLKQLDLADKAENKAIDLSGGQKQRVCIARALVSDPDIVFADEPTGNLDSDNGQTVIETLFRLQKEKGITLVIVTHDQDIAKKCEKQVVIKDGLVSTTK